MKDKPVANFAEVCDMARNDERRLVINWGAEGWGFGQLSFWEEELDGMLHCDNECMSRRFCLTVLDKLTEGMSHCDLPPLVRRFQTMEALLDACVPRNPGPDWPAPLVDPPPEVA